MRLRHIVIAGALCSSLVALGTSVVGAAAPAPAKSQSTVTAALTAGLKASALKGVTTPSLQAIASQGAWPFAGEAWLTYSCNTYNNPALITHPVACFFGNKASRKTIVLFGDSFVGNWLPAMNALGKKYDYRIAVLEYSGCPTAFVTFLPASCVTWHDAIVRLVRALKPAAVVSASGAPSWGTALDKTWVAGMVGAFQLLAPKASHALRFILGTGPHFPAPIPECLAANASELKKCDYHWNPNAIGAGTLAPSLERDVTAAKAMSGKLIPTIHWTCNGTACPAVVDGLLVDIDADHMSIAYSTWLSTVLTKAFVAAGLPK